MVFKGFMIKLRLILFEIQYSKKDAYSWLNPAGEFKPIDTGDVHDSAAQKILNNDPKNDNIKILFSHGWQRISYIGNTLYTNNSVMKPNYKQKSNLVKLAQDNGFEKLIWDSYKDDRVLWSNGDL